VKIRTRRVKEENELLSLRREGYEADGPHHRREARTAIEEGGGGGGVSLYTQNRRLAKDLKRFSLSTLEKEGNGGEKQRESLPN